jgi:hypothetical protein
MTTVCDCRTVKSSLAVGISIPAHAGDADAGLSGERSMRLIETTARRPISGIDKISLAPVSSTCSRPLSPFIAIHGQCAHDTQVAPSPRSALRAGVLPGAASVHLVEDAVVGGDDEFGCGRVRAASISWVVEPTTSASAMTPRAIPDAPAPRHRVLGLQRFSASALNASCTTHGPARAACRRRSRAARSRPGDDPAPRSTFALLVQVCADHLDGDAGGHHPVGTRLHRGAGVGVDHHLRSGCASQNAANASAGQARSSEHSAARSGMITRFSGFRILAVSPMNAPRRRSASSPDGRDRSAPFRGIGYAAAGFLGQVLQIGRGVVMRHQHRILLDQQGS